VGSTLVGVSEPEQLDPALAATGVQLPDDALRACDRIAKEIRYPLG
jgi:aryl-alcohol dehydrogenase-like predicted oxidoreductase